MYRYQDAPVASDAQKQVCKISKASVLKCNIQRERLINILEQHQNRTCHHMSISMHTSLQSRLTTSSHVVVMMLKQKETPLYMLRLTGSGTVAWICISKSDVVSSCRYCCPKTSNSDGTEHMRTLLGSSKYRETALTTIAYLWEHCVTCK